jgi:prevent-host-death family protein
MPITTLTSREFNQDTSRAKRGPVFVTDRGSPAHVLLTIDDYRKLTAGHASIIDLPAMPGSPISVSSPPRMKDIVSRSADLS